MIIGQVVETGFQCYGRDNSPVECRLQLGAEVILGAFSFIQTEFGFVYFRAADITQVIGQRRHEYGEVEFLLGQFLVHTDTHCQSAGDMNAETKSSLFAL